MPLDYRIIAMDQLVTLIAVPRIHPGIECSIIGSGIDSMAPRQLRAVLDAPRHDDEAAILAAMRHKFHRSEQMSRLRAIGARGKERPACRAMAHRPGPAKCQRCRD